MYYHASSTKKIKELEPRISNHKKPLIYFSSKRENVLVYLSNAIKKYCIENNFNYDGIYTTWASYSFDKDGILVVEEYYPNALEETYKGISGYIYYVNKIDDIKKQPDIPFAFITNHPVKIDGFEYIKDAYDEIILEEAKGNIKIIRYEDFIKQKKEWLYDIINKEYNDKNISADYKYFLESKFNNIINKAD